MMNGPRDSLAPLRTTGTGLAGLAAIFFSFLFYCRVHGLIFRDDVTFAVSAGWASAATLSWGVLFLASWANRHRLGDAAVGPVRTQAGLFALAMAAILITDAVAMQLAALFWTEHRDAGDVLARGYGFIPRAAMLSAILMLSLILWRRHAPAPAASAPVADSLWLDFPEAPLLRLRAEDVRMIRSAGNYSEILCAERTWLVRAPIGDLAARLLPRGFVRVHRQSIVNARHVRAISRDHAGRPMIELACGEKVLVGRSYRDALDTLTES